MVAVAKACEECTRKCQLLHSHKTDISSSVVRFFKVLVGKDFSQLLLLPRKFANRVKHLVDQEIKLEDSDGVQWTVALSSVKDSLAFKRGWQEFSLNHNPQAGDFLVFNYFKGAHFVVQIFGKSCCEIVNFGINVSLYKRARIKGNIPARGILCEKTDINVMKRQSSSTSVVSGSNLENSHIQPTTTIGTPNSEGGNRKWSWLDSSFDMMIERDACPGPGEDRTCLYDLSTFEVQVAKQVSDIASGIDAVQDTSNHCQINMRSQGEADKDPMGTKDLNMATFTTDTKIGMIVNDYNLEPKDDRLLQCEKVPSADLSNSLSMGSSCAELGKKGDNVSNVGIQLKTAEKSKWNYGDIKKRVKKEQLDTGEQAHYHAKRLRGLEPSTVKESGSSSPGPHVCKPVKLEPVDSLDMSSSVSNTLTCLAMMDGRHYLELPAKLPAITCRKGTIERKAVLLQDQERRFWPALYHHRSGFHVLTSSWDKFNKEHRIQAGDHYVFQVEDVYQDIYKVGVLHQ